MGKKGLFLIVVIVLALGGCQKSSDQFLSYKRTAASTGYDMGNDLTIFDFKAKNLVIVPKSENNNEELIGSEAAFLADVTDQKALYTKNIYEKLYPASLTKLLTALVALKQGELTDTVTISFNASHIPDPAAKMCGYEEGDKVSLDVLLHSLLVYSGNDAAIAIAEHVGGSVEKFVELMNEEARQLGAVHSNFVNPNGLHDEKHYSTAYDLYLIFNELIKYDTFRSIINLGSYKAEYLDKDGSAKEKTFASTDLYLTGEEKTPENVTVIGGKTGTTYKAGNCLILLSEDVKKNDYIAVILKASDSDMLYEDMTELLSMEAEDPPLK